MYFDDDEKDRRKRRKNPFDDFLDDDEFERIFDDVQKMFESSNFKEMIEDMLKGGSPNKKFVHGFSLNIGPDGKPRIQEFGNKSIKTPGGEPVISEEREPLTDIIEGDEDVSVTVEIPGVDKKDITLNVKDSTLVIDVDNPQRKYHKKLELPCDVRKETTKATYKNGVLDIVIKRKEKKKPGEGYHVNIE